MLDKKDFSKMASEMEDFDKKRESIIKESRDILKLAKQAIYDIHRDDITSSGKKIDEAKKIIEKLRKEISNYTALELVGAFNDALEEYAEAHTYYNFVKNKKIPSRKEVGVDTETYLCALSDLTGELGRRAVNMTLKKEFKEVKTIQETVQDIYGEFLKFNLRNGELRKKSDSIKYNMKKIEDIMYDIKTRKLEE